MPQESPHPVLIVLLVLVALGVLLAVGVFAVRRRYRREVRAHGWTFVASPGSDAIHGLNCPPFGIGTGRRVEELVYGNSAGGVPFCLVTYDRDGVREQSVGCLRLSRALPEVHLSRPGSERRGIVGYRVEVDGWSAVAPDAHWASEAAGRLAAPLASLSALLPEITASLDGDTLVLAPFPRHPDAVAAALALAEPVVRAAESLSAPAPLVPAELSVYRHPDWLYRPVDNSALGLVLVTDDGFNHAASDVIYAETDALALVALTHTWDTRETRVVPGGQGLRTKTYTEHHEEALVEIRLGFPFGDLGVNSGRGGTKVAFESEDFNRSYSVRAGDTRFAYDVLHPQMMEWLLSRGARPFAVLGGHLCFEVADTDVDTIEDCLDLASGFFGRVRRYTWENLGLDAPPVPDAT